METRETLSSKDRATLRGMANNMPAIFRLGKDGITDDFLTGIREALEARELIKIDILNNCELDVKDAAHEVARRTNAHVVQVIGKRFVLYRKSYTRKEGIL